MPPTTFTGGADRARTNASRDQPLVRGLDQPVSSRGWQPISSAESKRVADIKIRISTIDPRVGQTSRSIEVVGKCVGGSNIDRVRPGVGSQCLPSARKSALKFHLQCVIVGRCR